MINEIQATLNKYRYGYDLFFQRANKVLWKNMSSKQVLLIFAFKLIGNIAAVNLANGSDGVGTLISKQLNQILQLCLQNHLNPLIITQESSEYIFDEPQQAFPSSSTIMINDEFKIQSNTRNYNPHKATFILTASSDDQLNRTLSKLHSTPWWNTESYFLVIGPSTHSCAEASKILSIMWKRRILSVVVLCYHLDKEAVMLYTFNPFVNYAPDPWKWVEEISDKPDSRWTLYELQYPGGQKMCPTIMYDKTLRLDGYVISAIMDKKSHEEKVPLGVPISLSDYKQYATSMGVSVMTEVFTHMKVQVNITVCNGMWITREGEFHGSLQDLLDRDIYLRMRPMYLGYQYTTYSDGEVSYVLLGQKRPFLSTEEKIFGFFHFNILIPIIIVFIMSAVILRINRQQECVLALLKIWQLFLGNCVSQPLNNTPTRIVFIGTFWLVIILNGAFQSKLASFLTKPERTYVKDIDDAFKLHYQVYGAKDFLIGAGYLELPVEKRKYLRFLDTHRCVDQVLNNSQAVCLTAPNYSTRNAKKYGLYVSPPVHQFYKVNWISPGFPLKNRIDTTILYLQASGFMVRLYREIFFNRLEYLQAHEIDETKFNFRPIELHDLLFIFKFLSLGLVFSLIIFIVEIRYRKNCTSFCTIKDQ